MQHKKKVYLFIFAAMFYLMGVLLYASISYKYGKEKAMQNIDTTLNSVASASEFLLSQYHDKTSDKQSINTIEYKALCENLNKLTSYFECKYIYSFVERKGKVYFTSSSFTKKDVKDNIVSLYFDHYDEATPKLIKTFKSNQKIYEEAKDQWGYFRTILLPLTSPRGNKYIVGVDIEISHINKLLLKKLVATTFTGLFFLLLVIPFCIIYIMALKKDNEELAQLIEDKTKELKKSNDNLNEKNTKLTTLSNKLSKYLSGNLYNSLFDGTMDVKISSQTKYLSVFFSDIVNFTKMTNHMNANDLTNLINHYLNEMCIIAEKYEATLDKYIGDAVLIFFGDPESKGQEADAFRCVQMAMDMQNKLKELLQEPPFDHLDEPFKVRMGISSGLCTVGNFGALNHMDYTIIGNPVNLASRLESSAKPETILISQETYNLVKERAVCDEQAELKVKGFDKPVKSFTLIEIKTEAKI